MQVVFDFLHDARYAACIIEVLRGPLACGTDIQKIMRAAVHAVERIRVERNAELMRDGGQVHQRVCGAGDGRVYHDGVFERFQRDDIGRFHALFRECHGGFAGFLRRNGKIFAGGGHQRRAGQHEAERFRHNLHGGRGAHERACTAGGACVVLVIRELLLGDLTALIHGAVFADLLQR